MVGVNGSGKDTIGHEIIDRRRELVVLSGAQILMHNLGMDVGIEVTFPPQTTSEMYRQLEQTPKEVKAVMCDTVFKDTLQAFRATGKTYVLFSQLVVAFTLANNGGGITFQPEDTTWYPEVFDQFVYVRATPEELTARRERDLQNGARNRGRIALSDLQLHQQLYDQVWEDLTEVVGDPGRMFIVQNTEGKLADSVRAVEQFLFSEPE